MSGPLMMLTIVAAAGLALGAATWLFVGVCRAGRVGAVGAGRGFGGGVEA